MAPNDFGLNPSSPSSPSDGMTRKSLLLSEEAALAQDSAMDLLSRSMASQREISPSQGIAAALLAAIPTLGGYLIGKSVGTSKVPEGVLFDPSKLDPTGGYVGGLAGSQIGANASKDYTGAIETDNLHKQKVLAAEAQIENDRAQQLRQQANTVENAALNIDAQIAMLPIEMQQFYKQQEARVASEKELIDYRNDHPSEGRSFGPAAIALAEKNGINLANISPQEASVITRLAEEQRRAEAQDINLSGERVSPPSVQTKEKLKAALATKAIGERYLNTVKQLASKDPGVLGRTIQSVLPQTELGKMQQDLDLFAVQVRNSRENGVMTEKDFERYANYLKITPLDTFQSVAKRMQELQTISNLSAQSVLTAAKAGQENVARYEELLGFKAPTSLAAPAAPSGFNPQDPGYIAWKAQQGIK